MNRGGRPFDSTRPPRPKREKGSTRSRIREPLQKAEPGATADSPATAQRKPPRPKAEGQANPAAPRPAQSAGRPGGPAKPAPVKVPVAVPPPLPAHEPDYHATSWSDQEVEEAAVGPEGFRCGAVTLVGQPNAGKSTLTNRLLGEKLSIVSHRPQTTRDNLRGILTTPRCQIALIDTPGIHKARSPLNRAMVGQAVEALESVDVVVLVVDAVKAARHAAEVEKEGPGDAQRRSKSSDPQVEAEDVEEGAEEGAPEEKGGAAEKNPLSKPRIQLDARLHPGDRRVIRQILEHTTNWMVALNKIDLVKPRHLLAVMEALGTAPNVGPIVPVSAWTADGLRHLISAVEGYLPVGEMAFAPDELTDRPLRYLVAELVREQVFLQIREEVPYGVACETEVYEELEDLSHIQVVVHVEKPAQRAILVGKAGSRMKQIATAARLQMEQLCGRKVFLEIHVRVEPSWSERMDKLRDFGYLVD